jgi:hypothetical protein
LSARSMRSSVCLEKVDSELYIWFIRMRGKVYSH